MLLSREPKFSKINVLRLTNGLIWLMEYHNLVKTKYYFLIFHLSYASVFNILNLYLARLCKHFSVFLTFKRLLLHKCHMVINLLFTHVPVLPIHIALFSMFLYIFSQNCVVSVKILWPVSKSWKCLVTSSNSTVTVNSFKIMTTNIRMLPGVLKYWISYKVPAFFFMYM